MTKYGFVRSPEDDFSDDGARFTCYRVGTIRVSKTTWNGQAFISGDAHSFIVPYEVYSALPHYKALDALNGVEIADITDDDLFDLYEACVEYGKELAEAESKVVFPTIDEIREQCLKIRANYQNQVSIVQKMISDNATDLILKLSDYDLKTMKDRFKTLQNRANGYDPNTYPQTIYGKAYSFDFVKPNFYDLTEDWYFREIKGIVEKVI